MKQKANKIDISIYATVYNNFSRVDRSLNSIIKQFPDFSESFEFIIVDNCSNDGTWEILQKFAKRYKNIKLIREHCSRGKGRGDAFNNTVGEYTFYVDLDTVYNDNLSKVIYKLFSIKFDGLLGNNMGFARRNTILSMGGWKELLASEDTEFFARAVYKLSKIYWIPINLMQNEAYNKSFRELRYANLVSLRTFRIILDTVRADGITLSMILKNKNMRLRTKILYFLAFLYSKLFLKKIYNYSDKRNMRNINYMFQHIELLNPKMFKVPKSYYLFKFNYGENNSITNILVNELISFGFDKFLFGKTSIIGYNKLTNRDSIDLISKRL